MALRLLRCLDYNPTLSVRPLSILTLATRIVFVSPDDLVDKSCIVGQDHPVL